MYVLDCCRLLELNRSDQDKPTACVIIMAMRESYALIPPFAYALIQTDQETKTPKYTVVEVPLTSKEEEILRLIREIIIEEIDVSFDVLEREGRAREYLRQKTTEIVRQYGLKMDEKTFDKIHYHIDRDFVGYGPVEPLLRDPNIEDISCDGIGVPLYVVHRKHESMATNLVFDDEEELDSFIIKLAQRAGRHISIANPLLDAALPDGSRIQLTYGKEVTMHGSTFTVRKFREDPMTCTDLISLNTIDEDMGAYFWYALEHRNSVLIAGGTAAGKTTLLNSLAMFIRPGMKIVSIEDTAELNIPHENWIPSVARQGYGGYEAGGLKKRGEVDMFDLLRAALRQRPDYLFVGEVRGSEAYNLFQAMATGHSGMGTIHGDSVMGVVRRLESEPMNIPRALVQSLDVVAIQRRVRRAYQMTRRTTDVVEVVGVDPTTNDLITNKIYGWNPRDDTFTNFGRSYVLDEIREQQGFGEEQIIDELERRRLVLRWMVKTKKNHYRAVAETISRYYQQPDQLVALAKKELKTL